MLARGAAVRAGAGHLRPRGAGDRASGADEIEPVARIEVSPAEAPSPAKPATAAVDRRRGLRGAGHRACATTSARTASRRVLVAVSGGIDSALVALVAADALGADRLTCVVMPSPHSSDETQADGRAIAANLGAELIEIPISEAMDAYAELLEPSADGDVGGQPLASPPRTSRPGSAAT